MDAQQLSTRIADIQQEMETAKANYAKLEGHLNECSHWLQQMVAARKEQEQVNPEEVNDAATMDCLE